MTNQLTYKDPDSLLRLTLHHGEVRVLMARTTRMTQQAADIHQASDVATSAMGRLLSVCAMMGGLNKENEARLTVSIAGNGVGGRMTCGVQANNLKITVENPQASLPLLQDDRQDVAGFVGNEGQIAVAKDFEKGEPFTSLSRLVSGELGEDFAHYFTISEQVPSLVALGCLNQDGVVLSAGGILIQAMPGCPERTIRELETRMSFFANISREIYDRSLEELATTWFEGMEPTFLGEEPLHLQCDCNREKMMRALLALGRAELNEIVSAGEDTHLTCHFCRTQRSFTSQEIASALLGGNSIDAD